jgi:hypothetical protein
MKNLFSSIKKFFNEHQTDMAINWMYSAGDIKGAYEMYTSFYR